MPLGQEAAEDPGGWRALLRLAARLRVPALIVLVGLLGFGLGLGYGPAAGEKPAAGADPSLAAVATGPGTVWVNTETGTYYRPHQHRFGNAYPGVYMLEFEAVARGYRPSLVGD